MPGQRDSSLSMAIIELATDLFAREYGLSGPQIHSAFAPYTDVLGTYPMGDKPSRWMIFQRGMEALDEKGQRAVLRDLLERGAASDENRGDRLRQMLASGVDVTAQQIEDRLQRLDDWQIVRRDWKRALETLESDPDGAIRAARSSLESVCKHICDERDEGYAEGGDLSRLYKAAARSLDLAPDHHAEQVIKQILSGGSTAVQGLAALRNSLSDAHGKGKDHVGPAPRHARLAVNMAFTIATFLIDTHLEK